jgi:long-chain fatty acid transport protein
MNEHVSLGIGLNFQRVQADLTNAINYTAVVAQGLQQLVAAGQLAPSPVPSLLAANTSLEGSTKPSGDDSTWGYNVGILFTAPSETRIGLSYRSSMEYELDGSVHFVPPMSSNAVGNSIMAAASATNSRGRTGIGRPVVARQRDALVASITHARAGPAYRCGLDRLEQHPGGASAA